MCFAMSLAAARTSCTHPSPSPSFPPPTPPALPWSQRLAWGICFPASQAGTQASEAGISEIPGLKLEYLRFRRCPLTSSRNIC